MKNQVKFLLNRGSDAIFFNIPTLVGVLAQIITLPIILPSLMTQDYGLFQFIIAIEAWFTIFTVPYISSGAKRGIVRNLDGTVIFSYLARLKFSLIALVFIWIIAVIVGLIGGFGALGILLFLFGMRLVLGMISQETWREFFVAKKKFREYAFWRGIDLALTPIVGMIAAIQTHNIIVFAVVGFGFSIILNITAFGYIIWKYRLIYAYRQGNIDKEVVPYGIKMIPASFAMSVSGKGASLLIGAFFGFANLAVFAVADKIISIFRSFLKSGYFLFYADFAKLSWESLVNKIKKGSLFGLVIAFLLSIPLVLAGYFYVHLFLPDSYQVVKLYLLILTLGLPPIALKNIIRAVLESYFKTKEILFVSVIPNILRLAFLALGGFLFGIIGIIWAVVLSAWVEYGFYYFTVMRTDKSKTSLNKKPQKNGLIILTSYWNERYLIKPSLRQIEALNPCEIFICDGCFDPKVFPSQSTDGTREIIEKFVETHPNAHFISALRPGFFSSTWSLLRGHKHLPWWTIFRPVRWKFLLISFGKVAYRRNQAIAFNRMISLSQKWKPNVWFMTYDADHFYTDETIEKIKEITNSENNFDLITANELAFFISFEQYTDDHDKRGFANMPHKIYADTLIQPTKCMIRETKSGRFSFFNYRKILAKHLYINFASSIKGGTYFHYKLNPPERLKAGYQLGDRKAPNPSDYKMKQFKGKHSRIIREYFGL